MSQNQKSGKFSPALKEQIKLAVKLSLLRMRRSFAYEISLTFVDDAEIQVLNRDYRGKDRPTDVLSFAFEDGPCLAGDQSPEPLLGDIIISVERALDQAEQYQHSFEREVIFLTVHGMLHLLGLDHMEAEERRHMEKIQKDIMAMLNVPRREKT